MDKLIKNEVIKLYVSQILLLIVSAFCSCVPLFSDTVSISGYKALAGLFIIAAIIVFEIIFITTWFYGLNAKLPSKFCLESMNQVLFEAEINFKCGLFSEEDTSQFKRRFRNIMEWLCKMDNFSKYFVIIDLLFMILIVLVIALKQISLKQLFFSNMYGISAFFLILQISSLYITCKFLFKTVVNWIDKLHGIHITNYKE